MIKAVVQVWIVLTLLVSLACTCVVVWNEITMWDSGGSSEWQGVSPMVVPRPHPGAIRTPL